MIEVKVDEKLMNKLQLNEVKRMKVKPKVI